MTIEQTLPVVFSAILTLICGIAMHRINAKLDARDKADIEAEARRQERAARREIEHEAIVHGLLAILRNEIVTIYSDWQKAGKHDLPLYEREILSQTYQAYHSLGGNGTVSELFAEMTGAARNEHHD